MEKGFWSRRHSGTCPQDELEVQGRPEKPSLQIVKACVDHPYLKDFELWLDSLGQCFPGQCLQEFWKVEEDMLPHIDRTCIKRDQLRIEGEGNKSFLNRQITTRNPACRQTEDGIRFVPNAIYPFFENSKILSPKPRLWIPHMNMENGSAGSPGFDPGPRNLFRSDGNIGCLLTSNSRTSNPY